METAKQSSFSFGREEARSFADPYFVELQSTSSCDAEMGEFMQ